MHLHPQAGQHVYNKKNGSPSIVGVEQQIKRNKGSCERERTAPLNIGGAEDSGTEILEAELDKGNVFEYRETHAVYQT
ncbi:MAG: hypothetical protein VB034_05700 [Eubacteriales bacterium]|nr:hypothetical protein [Eubacteriales bacterium]